MSDSLSWCAEREQELQECPIDCGACKDNALIIQMAALEAKLDGDEPVYVEGESVRQSARLIEGAPDAKAGRKFDQGKTRWSLLTGTKAARMVAEVLTYGAKKYAPNNFKYVKGWRWRYVDAAYRHMNAYLEGDAIDSETGYHHLSHAICCLIMLLDNELNEMPNGDDE